MITDKILEIFKEVREDHAEPYQEDNFFQFLIKQNGKKIDDTFKGKRYKIRFLDKIQMEFDICFPDDVYNKTWSLSDFSAYVDDRRNKKDANLRMAQKRLDQSKKSDINLFVLSNALLLPLFFLSPYLLVLPLTANALLLWFKYQGILYNRKLAKKISVTK